MPSKDLDILRHQEWLGLLQPVGLVVSPPALIKAQAVIDRGRLVDLQERLREVISTEAIPRHKDDGIAWIENFPAFTQKVLDWVPQDLVPAADLPDSLSAVLPSYGETLRPTYGVKDPDSDEWILLIQELAPGLPLDEDDPAAATGQGWKASFQAKFERLLRETGIAAGLLVNGTDIRLVYAPSGESSGYLTFPVQAMTEVPGRLILGALDLLLGADRLFNVPENQRLNRLLVESRNYQAEVSTKLAEQVLDALWELLRGFQAADAAVNGKLLGPLVGLTSPPSPLSTGGEGGPEGEEPQGSESPSPLGRGVGVRANGELNGQHIYGGLITTLMRLVFLLYAEDEGLMPDDEVYQRNYAVSGLYEKLREDAGSYPDTMDQRYGAWATLLSLFRLVYDGGGPTEEYLPARHGQLFDPDEYPFLEGRVHPSTHPPDHPSTPTVPRIPDGTIYRMLDKLLMLDGERLSYRALDVEQIGSVYEAIMGYEVEVAEGRSIAVKPKDVVVNVEALLATKGKDRAKALQDWAECKVTGKSATALKQAETVEDLVAALERRVSSRTPNLLPPGSLYLQPGEERRRTGSHYTPRKLTQPIVETTLRPVLEALGPQPTPDQILALKVCDLAMGSAAFLVEACRQLAEKLVEAWDHHGTSTPSAEKTSPPSPLSTGGEGEPEGGLTPPSPLNGEGGRGDEVQPVPGYIYSLCRELRKEQTNAEGLLWGVLRNRQFEGLKFRRQHPLGRYIADFYCAEHRLVIELDGSIHDHPEQQEYDRIREEAIRAQNLTVLRFRNEDVETNLENVLWGIYQTVSGQDLTSPPSPLSTRGEGEQEGVPEREAPQGAESPSPRGRGVGVRANGDWGYEIPDDIEPLLLARRLVAQRCLYGVDKNPFAVNLAKLSLWLVTLAKDQPFTFVDHALKCGDSLVGLTRAEIGSFGKDPTEDLPLFKYLKEKVDRAKSYRAQIQALDTRTDQDAEAKLAQLHQAEQELEEAKLIGDVKIAAFFDGKSKKDRDAKLSEYGDLVRTWRQSTLTEADPSTHPPIHPSTPSPLTEIQNALRNADKPITPFNWEIEFPEVFDRENPGFDAIVGNPPFMGGKKISGSYSKPYLHFIQESTPEAGGQADLVCYFFRRAFNIIRENGTFGLVATNTISQGDTRFSGLRWICVNDGILFDAKKNYRWPGAAAVMVSIVHGLRGNYSGNKFINGRKVEKITAYLFDKGNSDNPYTFLKNGKYVSKGIEVGCPAFIFDDSDADSLSMDLMRNLIRKNPKNEEKILHFIGGDEILNDPKQEPYRYVINLHGLSNEEILDWPDLIDVLKERVESHRQQTGDSRITYWCYRRPGILTEDYKEKQYLVRPFTSKFHVLAFIPTSTLVSTPHAIILSPQNSTFSILQSQIHELWSCFFGSSLEDRLRYPTSDCFETFPFPVREAGAEHLNWETDPTLEAVGKTYYEYRADLMVRNNQGLTDTYNRFHDPEERDPDILQLRDLHKQMDRAVLNAYGWHDIDTTCGFALDYLDADPDDLPPEAQDRIASGDLFFPTPDEAAVFDSLVRTGKRKLPWRYRWPETTHDEVLARLLDLNQQRHLEEVRGHKAAKPSDKGKRVKGKGSKKATSEAETPTIPGMEV